MGVTREGIAAAGRLRDRLHGWDAADDALEHLKASFPSNHERFHVLAKASAIDKLYSTRAGNIYWVANALVDAIEEVHQALSWGIPIDAADVVNAVSRRKTWLYPGSARCASFASKYCHFFVDGWDFLIYDSFALAAVNNLLGVPQRNLTPNRSEYRDFCERVERLVERDGLQRVGVRELDRYLWLWGQWVLRDGGINSEVLELFRSADPHVQNDISLLAPVA